MGFPPGKAKFDLEPGRPVPQEVASKASINPEEIGGREEARRRLRKCKEKQGRLHRGTHYPSGSVFLSASSNALLSVLNRRAGSFLQTSIAFWQSFEARMD